MNYFKVFLPFTLFLVVILSACESSNINNDKGYSIYPVSNDTTTITNSSKNTEYAAPTGKWFIEGGGSIGFGVSAGTMKPNSEVSVSLLAHPVAEVGLDKEVRFQLTKRDKDNNLIEVVKEKIIHIKTITSEREYFSTNLPNIGNVHYILSTEILGEDGQVEDTLISSIYVPDQLIYGKLYLEKDSYSSSETLKLKLDNKGPTNLSFGLPYKIEIYKQDKWEQISIDVAFEMIGLDLKPGQTFEQNISLNQLKEEGRYRILKDISADGTDFVTTLKVVFSIE
ncbi:immunoglobulin-like domain-containing protein [Fredinandcohnia sp. 179-A 10B2 NHS]|uniref:immunoglobulin-like domain-containing protein n=1 Tax=Fredinandcohnia sp. 179-A 10B2 NHS TaxID=3235176 RepID=UPI00399F4D2F